MIEIRNLYKNYGKKKVLTDINLELKYGNVYALMGPNGAGKTTLLKCLLGLVKPDKGTILVNSRNISEDYAYRNHIGYMPQFSSFPENLSVMEVIDMLKDLKGKKYNTDEELLNKLKIKDFHELPVSKLSGGMKQRLNCTVAFLFSPQIIILDEPTAGLDPVSADIVKTKILSEKNKGRLIIVTTHIIPEAEEISDYVVYMLDGKIQFRNSVKNLVDFTNNKRLGSAVASMLKNLYENKN
jgi:Cu-processing system ATP-binding protein